MSMYTKINLIGDTFLHQIESGLICSTNNQKPKKVQFVTDGSGEKNLFVDSGIYEINKINNDLPSYAWLLESKSIRPDLVKFFMEDTQTNISKFNKIFTHNNELIQKDKKFEFIHPTGYWVDEKNLKEKTKLVSMIASSKKNTPMQKKRNRFANKMQNKIDVFGEGRYEIENKEDGLSQYYFSYVFENDLTPDYFSEKILDCFAMKTIPIYFGTPTINKYFHEEGIIYFKKHKLSSLSKELYYEKMSFVNENYQTVIDYKIPEDSILNKMT